MRLADLPYSVADLFPKEEFAFTMKFRRGEIGAFFRNREGSALLGERRKWLNESPQRYCSILPEASDILREATALAQSVGVEVTDETLIGLGGAWEPDLLMLRASADQQPHLIAGCVCFPSSWSLEEKIGHPLDVIHKPVATLNEQFAAPIQQFMARLKPGISWERINWGLSRSPELNQHPARKLPRLDATVAIEDVWFRAEYQSLVPLPASNGVLFGIRLVIEPLRELRENPEFAAGLARALRTMPEAIARYKALADARAQIVSLLT